MKWSSVFYNFRWCGLKTMEAEKNSNNILTLSVTILISNFADFISQSIRGISSGAFFRAYFPQQPGRHLNLNEMFEKWNLLVA